VDMSILLASVLLGSGYDALCVVGSAPRAITSNDASCRDCPEHIPEEAELDGGAAVRPAPRSTRYALRQRPALVSAFDREEAERRSKDIAEIAHSMGDSAPQPNPPVNPPDELEGRRFHCWVLVRRGARAVADPFFVEPSTGEVFPLDSPHRILAVDAVFNATHYWANRQPAVPGMSFDFADPEAWEGIVSDAVGGVISGAEGTVDRPVEVPGSWASPLTLTPRQYEGRYPGNRRTITYRDATVEYFAAFSEADLKVRRVTVAARPDAPAAAAHTFFAHRKDRLRRRTATEGLPPGTAEWFEPGRTRESGAPEALRHVFHAAGHRLELHFFPRARTDGLLRRIERYRTPDAPAPAKVKEFFEGRDDRLVSRSTSHDPISVVVFRPSTGAAGRLATDERPTMRRLAEKFERDPSIPAERDVAKRVYLQPGTPEVTYRLTFHFAPGKITASSRTYRKGQPVTIDHTDPFLRDPSPTDLAEELRALALREAEALAAALHADRDAREILAQREREEAEPVAEPLPTAYDVLHHPHGAHDPGTQVEGSDPHASPGAREGDYLAAYLRRLPGGADRGSQSPDSSALSREDATQVREACLRDLKERLIQRARGIQQRLDDEREKLTRKQAEQVKAQGGAGAVGEYGAYCEGAVWRIRLLERRLEEHQADALRRYADLDRRLRADRRLAALDP
jgi:hypothetical protein